MCVPEKLIQLRLYTTQDILAWLCYKEGDCVPLTDREGKIRQRTMRDYVHVWWEQRLRKTDDSLLLIVKTKLCINVFVCESLVFSKKRVDFFPFRFFANGEKCKNEHKHGKKTTHKTSRYKYPYWTKNHENNETLISLPSCAYEDDIILIVCKIPATQVIYGLGGKENKLFSLFQLYLYFCRQSYMAGIKCTKKTKYLE